MVRFSRTTAFAVLSLASSPAGAGAFVVPPPRVGVGWATPAASRPIATPAFAAADPSDPADEEATAPLSAQLDHEHANVPTYDALSITSLDKYRAAHAESVADPGSFWSRQAQELLEWSRPHNLHAPMTGSLDHGDVTWFAGGRLNVCHNAVDRHVEAGRGDDVALVWEGDEPTDTKSFTYSELQRRVSQIANALRSQGVGKGDVVTIYMPMTPELPMTMLACARIGAVHSVVFAGFSAVALAQRVSAAGSRFVVTADVGLRGTKRIPLKGIVDESLTHLDCEDVVEKVLVYERFYGLEGDDDGGDGEEAADSSEVPPPSYEMGPKDVRMDPLIAAQRPYCVPVEMDAEDNLFILYTSGSTGSPKGLVHTTGGYALYAAFTTKTTFDLKRGDLFACVADCGWITGHTYVVYGALLNGFTTFVFESTPMYPDAGRYWDMVQRHGITHFYTAPTAIRSLMRYGDDIPSRYDLSSLKVLGTVGEPINPEAWRWYYDVIGRKSCTIVDTYWQTETGGHLCTNIPGVTPMKPGSCAFPMYGIDAVVLDPVSGEVLTDNSVEGVLAVRKPWPGMARTCLGDHGRYLKTYLSAYPGYYFTDDAVYRDGDGYLFITGRCDDVLNVSGHRIGTAEVESALVGHPAVAQAAVVGRPHPIKGQSICAFATLKEGQEEGDELIKEMVRAVRADVGPFASPDLIVLTPSLPMTRSGKIMRRILRKIVADESDSIGDTSTLADPSIVDTLIEKVAK